MGLVVHCGNSLVGRDRVLDCETPERTETHVPISHRYAVESFEEAINGRGLSIVEQTHSLNNDETRYFGLFKIGFGDDGGDYAFIAGVRNSHDKSFPLGYVCGSQVFVCDNLAFSGESVVQTRHTKFVMDRVENKIADAIGRLFDLKVSQDNRISTYKQTELIPQEAWDLTMIMAKEKAINQRQIPDIYNEFLYPRHPEFKERTVWSYMNAITECNKTLKGGLNEVAKRTPLMHGILDTKCGLSIST